MNRAFFPFLIIILIGIIGCKEVTVEKIKINLNTKSNSKTSGEVTLTEKDRLVTLEAHIFGLEPGTMPYIYMKRQIVHRTMESPWAVIGI